MSENKGIIVSNQVPQNEIYFLPKIDGLTVHDGELKVAEKVFHRGLGETKIQYRDLTDDEKRQFGKIVL